MKFSIRNTIANVVVAEYEADAPRLPYDIDTAYIGPQYETRDEAGNLVALDAINPPSWKVDIGSFFDRFGAAKLAILSSDDLVVQAIIKDASVRKYIDLYGRRAELEQAMNLLVLKGFPVNVSAILDTEPTADELWSK